MKLLILVALALALGVTACGATEESRPAASTETSEPAPPIPDVARVVCQDLAPPRIETPAVKPRPDGVHIEFVNAADWESAFSIEDPRGGGIGGSVPPGSSTEIVNLPPGRVTIDCYDTITVHWSEPPRSPLDIVDEEGIWISTELNCASDTGFSQTTDYIQGARGPADPLKAARKALESYLQPADVVEPAGYPDAEIRHYRLVRAGDVLAVVDLWDDGDGGWLADTLTGCGELEG